VVESVDVVASVEVVPSVDVPVVSVEVEVEPVSAVSAEKGSPSASAPEAITPNSNRAARPAATFATWNRRAWLVRSVFLPFISTLSLR
jgi:hypothetical protein